MLGQYTTSISPSPTLSGRSSSTSTCSGPSDGSRRSGIRPTGARRRSSTLRDKEQSVTVVSACVAADGGTHRYYDVGIEHFAFEVDRREEVDEAHARCLASGANVHFPPGGGSRRAWLLRVLRLRSRWDSSRSVLLGALNDRARSRRAAGVGRRSLPLPVWPRRRSGRYLVPHSRWGPMPTASAGRC